MTKGTRSAMRSPLASVYSILLPFFLFLSVCCAQTTETKKLTADEKKEINALMYQFNRTSLAIAERARAAEKVLKYGEPGATVLLRSVDSQLKRAVPSYRKAYERKAAKLFKSLLGKNRRAIKDHRKKIQDLSRKQDLAKEEIVKTSDPALEALRELLILTPEGVLEQDKYLTRDRKKIELLYKCQTVARSVFKKEPLDTWKVLAENEKRIAKEALYLENRGTKVLKYNLRLKDKVPEQEFIGIQDLNILRMLVGLTPVKADPKLCDAGRDHSKDMHTLKFFDHTSPVKGKETPYKRAKKFGTSARSENIFMGRTDPLSANKAWWHSPGHHRNMLGPSHEFVGLGQHLQYWTQMFR